MNAIKDFDHQLKETAKDVLLMANVVKYILLCTCSPLYLIPVTEEYPSFLLFIYLMVLPIYFHMQPLLYTKQNEKQISIYKILKQTPITKEEYLHSRFTYLNRFIFKLAGVCLLFQLLGNLFAKNHLFDIGIGLLSVLALFVLLYLIAAIDIRRSVR